MSGRATRYEASPGSRWWVTYGIANNGCADAMRIVEVQLAEPRGSGVDAFARVEVRPAANDAPIDAYWSGDAELSGQWRSAAGTVVPPGQRIQVAALVRVVDPKQPAKVPALVLTYVDATGGVGTIDLDPGTAFCVCPLPELGAGS